MTPLGILTAALIAVGALWIGALWRHWDEVEALRREMEK